MLSQIVRGREHHPLDLSKNKSENLERIQKFFSENSLNKGKRAKEMLGLHQTRKGLCPGNFIGAVWMGEGDDRVVLRVDSKFNDPTLDYMAMFAECCEHPIVGEKMHDCLEIWPEQELIEISATDDFSFMVVAAFLWELNGLCTRHLRRHFNRRRENFVGKVKGKILIGENLRRNIGHAERMFCEYQAISDDILENRILRVALEKAARYLSVSMTKVKISTNRERSETYSILQRWVHACRTHLQGIPVVESIARRDFCTVRSRGAFAPYRRPLYFAKAVLYHLGFNPHAEISKDIKTLPYAINSAKLFELYAELQLRNDYPDIVPQESIKNLRDKFIVTVCPDFYVSRQAGTPLIIDAKYKEFDWTPSNSDLYQMVAYLQHFGLLHEINKDHDNKEDDNGIELHLVYPWLKDMPWPEQNFTEAFKAKVYFHKIECPTRSETKKK